MWCLRSYLRLLISGKATRTPKIARRQFHYERKGDYGDRFLVSALFTDPSRYVQRVSTYENYLSVNLDVARGVLNEAADQRHQGKSKLPGPKQDGESRFALAGERTYASADTVLGANVSAGDRTSIKKSVVGSDVTLGSNVKLNGCVIMSGCKIMDKVNLFGCVIGCDSQIMSGSVLKNCRVGHGAQVEANTRAEDEAIREGADSMDGLNDDFFDMVP